MKPPKPTNSTVPSNPARPVHPTHPDPVKAARFASRQEAKTERKAAKFTPPQVTTPAVDRGRPSWMDRITQIERPPARPVAWNPNQAQANVPMGQYVRDLIPGQQREMWAANPIQGTTAPNPFLSYLQSLFPELRGRW